MVRPDPLQAAASYYTAERWQEQEWRQFGRETGTSDILSSHPRLYRSLSFGDDDYPDAAGEIVARILDEGVSDNANEAERMDLIADAMPDLPTWTAEHAPSRTKRLFQDYLDARDPSEIPPSWLDTSTQGADVSPIEQTFSQSGSPESFWVTPAEKAWDPPRFDTMSPPTTTGSPAEQPSERRIFVVHGHDEPALHSIQVYVHRETGIMPISLAQEAGASMTIIEKFESYGEKTSYAIVLLTPDDVGQTLGDHSAGLPPSPRARQNVVLELGYFISALGRKNIVVVNAGVERPSDLAGVGYVQYPGTNWKDDLRKELVTARLTMR
ncbi:nucleotide-binding protein [Paenarthrobacter sp. MSM-2-10-13]|uniref:TIR domain-containing protein n=1 Tax=unclassified Paenarthrobacter TaxID=2634190 RepID=UPI00141DE90E|nr:MULTISPECIES: TIR domain-containing protein [unclassified Paenarthrobacter]MCM0615994.1 nucleotide-binding protein [Paenarthrobacter sp. TYUT067]NHW48225.1 nucleotide-binding protein [Paenarthrobacter sp. MSM-2-10-13]